MWLLLFILLGLSSCFLLMLVISLLWASRRADEAEERILKIVSPTSSDDIAAEDVVDERPQCVSSAASVSEASTSK